jgi:hypothetical protein
VLNNVQEKKGIILMHNKEKIFISQVERMRQGAG